MPASVVEGLVFSSTRSSGIPHFFENRHNGQKTTNNKQQTTNNKQQTTNNK